MMRIAQVAPLYESVPLRRLAQRHGWRLRVEKSRMRSPQARGEGGYRLFDVPHNAVWCTAGSPMSIVPCWARSNAFYGTYRQDRRPSSADEAGDSHNGV
jgi:hypothetical protein